LTMKISLAWLKEYVELPGTLEELDSVLTNVGLEVENTEDKRSLVKDIVVGEVTSCEKHPNADKLSVCTVSDGENDFTVVCGAPNVRAGQKIAFARPGTYLTRLGLSIERRKIRGVESSGMICSEAELGTGEDKSGILVLSPELPAGGMLAEAQGFNDVSIEIGITPNRGDALSYIGIARDISAESRNALATPEIRTRKEKKLSGFNIRILAPDLCPRYSGALIRGVRNQGSPEWLVSRLEASGIRSISPIVDVTNFVMLECGQPMHAFDLRSLDGPEIVVRGARSGETFTTLDGREHALPENALFICDAHKPVALAGVMGGLNSEITDRTEDVFLESAFFDPASVRRTAKLLGISTESSYRFERRTDPERTVWALQRAVDLILECAGGSFEGIMDEYPGKISPAAIRLRPDRTDTILGLSIPASDQERILVSLGISIERDGDELVCRVPSWRSDLEREIDLIEEIARINGYDNILVPEKTVIHSRQPVDDEDFIETVRSISLALGFDEILTSSLISRDSAEMWGGEQTASVLNPVSAERPCLRPCLLSSMLETVDYNIRNGIRDLALFEVGSVFGRGREAGGWPEHLSLALLLTGRAEDRAWFAQERKADIFDMKGAVETFFGKFHLDNGLRFSYDRSGSLSRNELIVEVQGNEIGRIIEIGDEILNRFSIEQAVFAAEFKIDSLSLLFNRNRALRRISRFPLVERDLAFVVDQSVTAAEFISAAQESGVKFLKEIRMLDVYIHPTLGTGKKSMAVSLAFQSDERTLTDADIEAGLRGIMEAIQKRLQATLRA
jgi:phenylalanyl-tRNA synthetase beta chain